jgi:Flp pilus assembly protein TadG
LCIALVAFVGILGLAVDVGHVYVVKNEAQAFADMAALAGARYLNGELTGIARARTEVANSTNRWNFGSERFTSDLYTTEFSKTDAGPWEANPTGNVKGYAFLKVSARPVMNLVLLPVVGSSTTQQVHAQAIGGVIPQTFPAGGYMPFTPFAHDPLDEDFGFIVGQEYGFHWPSNVKKASDACAGDRDSWPAHNISDQVGGSDRGYFELQAASAIRDAILGERQMSPLTIGSVLDLTNGNKQAEQDALEDRAENDTDQANYQGNADGVAPPYTGNHMRLVLMPVNNGKMDANGNVKVVGFAAFLLPKSYPNGGNKPWCAIYMGSRVTGGDGAGTPYEGAGAYVVRLVQ